MVSIGTAFRMLRDDCPLDTFRNAVIDGDMLADPIFSQYAVRRVSDCGRVDAAQWLIQQAGLRPLHALHTACLHGHTDLARWLATNTEEDVDEPDEKGIRPVVYALRHVGMVQALVQDCGADPGPAISEAVKMDEKEDLVAWLSRQQDYYETKRLHILAKARRAHKDRGLQWRRSMSAAERPLHVLMNEFETLPQSHLVETLMTVQSDLARLYCSRDAGIRRIADAVRQVVDRRPEAESRACNVWKDFSARFTRPMPLEAHLFAQTLYSTA